MSAVLYQLCQLEFRFKEAVKDGSIKNGMSNEGSNKRPSTK